MQVGYRLGTTPFIITYAPLPLTRRVGVIISFVIFLFCSRCCRFSSTNVQPRCVFITSTQTFQLSLQMKQLSLSNHSLSVRYFKNFVSLGVLNGFFLDILDKADMILLSLVLVPLSMLALIPCVIFVYKKHFGSVCIKTFPD